jgi:hypothetical protein
MKLLGWLGEEREAYVLGLLRIAFSLLLLRQTYKRARELWTWGYFGHVFHLPLLPEAFVPSEATYRALLVVQALGCVLAFLGIFARPALFTAAFTGLFVFLCDRLQYHNNRYELLLLSLLVSLTPCDRSFLALRRGATGGLAPRWAARAVGAQVSIAYLASSLGKLFDDDWRGGVVMARRFAMGQARLSRIVPEEWASILTRPWFAHAASLSAIISELFLALGLWHRRTRPVALWLGVMFHGGIEISANVELFSYTMLCGYLVFVTPELRERRLSWGASGRRPFALFRRLDVLARFRHEQQAAQSELLVTTDREGRAHHGLAAWRELSRAMPPLFPLWIPLWIATFRPRR